MSKPWKIITCDKGEIRIFGNNHDIPIIWGHELTDMQKKEFDYIDKEEIEKEMFCKYKGSILWLGDFMWVKENETFSNLFDGFMGSTAYSGYGIKYTGEFFDTVRLYYFYN